MAARSSPRVRTPPAAKPHTTLQSPRPYIHACMEAAITAISGLKRGRRGARGLAVLRDRRSGEAMSHFPYSPSNPHMVR